MTCSRSVSASLQIPTPPMERRPLITWLKNKHCNGIKLSAHRVESTAKITSIDKKKTIREDPMSKTSMLLILDGYLP
jgi:hypothetical protein